MDIKNRYITKDFLDKLLIANKQYLVLNGVRFPYDNGCMELEDILNYMYEHNYELQTLPSSKYGDCYMYAVFKKMSNKKTIYCRPKRDDKS